MDGNSFAARDVADDAFATDGVTTARAVDQHIALAFDGDGVLLAAEDTAHHAGDGSGFVAEFVGSFDFSFDGGGDTGRKQPGEHLARRIFSVTDAGHEVVGLAQSIAGSDFQQRVVFDFF